MIACLAGVIPVMFTQVSLPGVPGARANARYPKTVTGAGRSAR